MTTNLEMVYGGSDDEIDYQNNTQPPQRIDTDTLVSINPHDAADGGI